MKCGSWSKCCLKSPPLGPNHFRYIRINQPEGEYPPQTCKLTEGPKRKHGLFASFVGGINDHAGSCKGGSAQRLGKFPEKDVLLTLICKPRIFTTPLIDRWGKPLEKWVMIHASTKGDTPELSPTPLLLEISPGCLRGHRAAPPQHGKGAMGL